MQTKRIALIVIAILFSPAFCNETNEKGYNNSIQLHPLFPLAILEELYLVEVDYVRHINERFSLLVKAKGKYDKMLYNYGLEANDQKGRHIRGEIELGIRRNFCWIYREDFSLGPYIQLSTSNGYQDLYYEEYEKTDTLDTEISTLHEVVSFKGFSGTLGATGGILLHRRRFVLSIDLGVGVKFYHLPEFPAMPGFLKPNISMGFRF